MRHPILQQMAEDMELRGLSPRTRDSYGRDCERYLDFLDGLGVPPERAGEDELRAWSLHMSRVLGLAPQTVNGRLCAALFLHEVTLGARSAGGACPT